MTEKNRAYHLKLGNGQEWQILSTRETEPLVDKLASILELEPCSGLTCPRMIVRMFEAKTYSSEDSLHKDDCFANENLPRSGWNLSHPYCIQFLSHADVPDVICEVKLEPGLYSRGIASSQDIVIGRWLMLPIIQRVLDSRGLTFHAGLAEWNGMGILFAGPPGMGKSTTCSRLPTPWNVLCDDESLVVIDDQGRFIAHPMPTWSNYFRGKSERTWNVRQHVPLTAIFYLERSANDDIKPIKLGTAAMLINDSARQIYGACQWISDQEGRVAMRKVVFRNALEIAKATPTFSLRLSLTGRFWEQVEQTLSDVAQGTLESDASASRAHHNRSAAVPEDADAC